MTDKIRRLRTPKMKDGELRVYWGREPHDRTPDVMFAWQGDAEMRRDTRLLHSHFSCPRPDPHVQPVFSKMLPSLIEELQARGYDITTLKFSIQKKALS